MISKESYCPCIIHIHTTMSSTFLVVFVLSNLNRCPGFRFYSFVFLECCMHGKDEKCIQHFGWNLKGGDHLEDLEGLY
jgi:hypothetical protein